MTLRRPNGWAHPYGAAHPPLQRRVIHQVVTLSALHDANFCIANINRRVKVTIKAGSSGRILGFSLYAVGDPNWLAVAPDSARSALTTIKNG